MLDFTTIRTLLFDMDGVLYRGKVPLSGVRELLAFCDQQDIHYACITNNATMTRQQYGEKLANLNIPIAGTQVFSSAMVTGHYVRTHYPRGTTVYAIGMQGLFDALFEDGHCVFQEHEPQLVVQGADFDVSYEKLKRACLAIRAGARFISTNGDRTFPSEEGLVPGAGALLALLQAATDVEPFVVGKPQPTMFEVAMQQLGSTPAATLMIGDRLETDIAGAQHAGLRSVLVLTGVTNREEVITSPYQPDIVVNDLGELLTFFRTHR